MKSYKRNKGIKVSYKGTKSLMIHPPRCNYYSVIFHIFHMVVHSGEIIIIHHFLKSKIKRQSGSHYQWCSSHATNYSSLYSFGTFESSWHCQTQYMFTSSFRHMSGNFVQQLSVGISETIFLNLLERNQPNKCFKKALPYYYLTQ